jgi:hypothetical protein
MTGATAEKTARPKQPRRRADTDTSSLRDAIVIDVPAPSGIWPDSPPPPIPPAKVLIENHLDLAQADYMDALPRHFVFGAAGFTQAGQAVIAVPGGISCVALTNTTSWTMPVASTTNTTSWTMLVASTRTPYEIRAEALRLQGLPEDEIAELCDPQSYPADLEEELANLEAAKRLQASSLTERQLADLARRFPAPSDW